MPVVLSRVRLAAAARMPDGHERVGRGFGEAQAWRVGSIQRSQPPRHSSNPSPNAVRSTAPFVARATRCDSRGKPDSSGPPHPLRPPAQRGQPAW